jgi:hypothetical protein
MPDFIEMTEEDRKRWRKKSRRRRSQLRKKMQREANKTSSESGTEPFPHEVDMELEVSPAVGSNLAETSPVRLKYCLFFTYLLLLIVVSK